MKSIANQYRDLKEGKLSQANFMRNLRMSMPQYITNVTSFNDAVRILKNKAVLTELGPAAIQAAGNPEEEAEYRSMAVKKKVADDEEAGFQSQNIKKCVLHYLLEIFNTDESMASSA